VLNGDGVHARPVENMFQEKQVEVTALNRRRARVMLYLLKGSTAMARGCC